MEHQGRSYIRSIGDERSVGKNTKLQGEGITRHSKHREKSGEHTRRHYRKDGASGKVKYPSGGDETRPVKTPNYDGRQLLDLLDTGKKTGNIREEIIAALKHH